MSISGTTASAAPSSTGCGSPWRSSPGSTKSAASDFPVGIRYSGEEYIEGGREIDESVKAAKLFRDAGAAFIDVSAGIFDVPGPTMDPMYYQQGWNTYAAEAIKKAVDVPVITTHSSARSLLLRAHPRREQGGHGRPFPPARRRPLLAEQGRRGQEGRDPQMHLLSRRLLAGIAHDQARDALRNQSLDLRRAIHPYEAGREAHENRGYRRRPGRT